MKEALLSTYITAIEAKDQISSDDLTEQLRQAMRVTWNHWCSKDEDEQFKAAVCAVMLHHGVGSEVYNRLQQELRQLAKLSAWLNAAAQGLSVDPSSIEVDEEFKPIGLMSLWKEIKSAQ